VRARAGTRAATGSDAVTVAAFVLGVIGTVFAAASLTWQVVSFLLQSARPKLTPVVGLLTPGGLVTNDASRDVRESLVHAATQLPPGPLIIGVKVVNAGRAPFHVAGWAIRADPGGTSLVPVDVPVGGTEVPHDIPPGASAMFITEMQHAHRFADVAERVEARRPQIVLTVSSGGRTCVSKPIAPENVAIESRGAQ
jgi:hypothetical protein